MVPGGFRIEGGHNATTELLNRRRRPDGLVVANNLMALGAMQCLIENDVSVPDDIAVVGFDDFPWATTLRPALTVVSQPIYDVGQQAAELVLRRIAGEQFPPRNIVLPPR